MGKCQWKPPEGAWGAEEYKGCPHPSRGDSDYCIFHLSLEEKREKPKLSDEFTKAFNAFFDDKFLNDDAGDFSGFVFPNDFDLSGRDFRRSYERDSLEVEPPEGHKPVIFRWATFGDRTNCSMAIFGDEVFFLEVTFGDMVSFHKASFGDNSVLAGATFGNGVSFSKATFGNNVSFRRTIFGDDVYFAEATFGDEVNFAETTFGDKAQFYMSTFGDMALFYKTTFTGKVNFSLIKSSEIAFEHKPVHRNDQSILGGFFKRHPTLWHIMFSDTIFNDTGYFASADLSRIRFEMVNLQNLSFFKSRISLTEFISCEWGSGPESRKHWHRSSGFNFGFRRPRLLLDELIWRKQNQKPASNFPRFLRPIAWLWSLHIAASSRVPATEAIDKIKPIDFLQAEDIEILGLQLKQSLEATKDPITAGDFHFAVMEMKLEKARAAGRFWRSVGLTLYKFINGYGERYARTMLWLALLVAIWTGLYFWNGELVPSEWTCREVAARPAGSKALPPPNTLWEYLLFALQNILPFKIGQPVLNPCTTLAKALSFAETFIGTSLFSFMILAMRRRFKR